ERRSSNRVAIARVGARLEDIAQYVYGTPVAARGLAALNGRDPFAPLGGGVVVHLTGKPLAEPALSSLVSSRPLPANCGDPDLFMMRKGMLDVSLDLDFNFIVRAMKLKSDRKSTRLNSSHEWISYAVFCLKKKTH